MKKEKFWNGLLIIVIISVMIAPALYGYLTKPASAKPVNGVLLEGMRERSSNAWNRKEIDSCISLLRSGDLVVRTGIDVTSYVFSRMNLSDKTYSHCGLVMIENGYPFVYHSIGGEDNPDACLRRDSVNFFFSPMNNFGFGIARFDLSPGQLNNLRDTVQVFYKEKKKFDLDFDLKTDDKFYCAEFVYKSIIKASGDSQYIKPISFMGHQYIGVDNLYLNPHARMICQVKFK